MRKYVNFTDKKIEKLPFNKGSAYCFLNYTERKLLLNWAISARDADNDPGAEEEHGLDLDTIDWYWKRIIVKLKGFPIENSNLDATQRRIHCTSCENEFVEPFLANHMARCKGKLQKVDREILERV